VCVFVTSVYSNNVCFSICASQQSTT